MAIIIIIIIHGIYIAQNLKANSKRRKTSKDKSKTKTKHNYELGKAWQKRYVFSSRLN